MTTLKDIRKAQREVRRTVIADGVRNLHVHHTRMASQWSQLWTDYASFVTDLAADVMDRKGSISCSEMVADSVAMSLNLTANIASCWKDLLTDCMSTAKHCVPAYIHFEIDSLAEDATGQPIGTVKASDQPLLVQSDLIREGSSQSIPKKHVALQTSDDTVYVYLTNLGALKPAAGFYLGTIRLQARVVAIITVFIAP